MPISIGDALLKLGIDFGSWDSDMAKLNADLKGLQEQSKQTALASAEMTKVGVAITGIGAAMTAFLGSAVKGAADEEAQLIRLSSVLSNVGVAYDNVRGDIERYLTETEKATAVNEDELRESLIQLVNITGDYQKALKLLPLALDLAAAKGINLSTASMLIGKVAQGNTTMLARYGIVLKEGASASEALAAIQARVGGTAEKYGKSTAGAMAQIKNSIDALMESIGYVLLPAVKFLANALSTLISRFNKMPGPIKVMGVALAVLTGALALVIGTSLIMIGQWPKMIQLWTGFKAIVMSSTVQLILHKIALGALTIAGTALRGVLTALTAAQWLLNLALNANPIGIIITAIGLLIAAGIALWRHWEKITSFFQKSFKIIGDGVSWLMRILTGAPTPVRELTDAEKEAAAATKALTEAQALNERQQEALTRDIEAATDKQEGFNAELEEARDLYDYTERNAAGYKDEIDDLNSTLKTQKKSLADAEGELKKLQTAYGNAEKKVSDFEDAISAANDRLAELSSPRLEGMQAYEDQIQAIQEKIDPLKVTKLQLEFQGFNTEDIDAQIAALENRKDILEAQANVEFGPQLYKLKEGVEDIQGANRETIFGTVWDEIQKIGASLAPGGELSAGLDNAINGPGGLIEANTALNAQKVIVEDYADAVQDTQTQLDILNDKVAEILKTQAEGIVGLENKLYYCRQAARELTDELNRVKAAAEAAATAAANVPNVPAPTSPTEVPGYGAYVTPMQHGAIALKPTLALVGEKEPEAVLPLDKLGNLLKGMVSTKLPEIVFPFEKLAALLRDEQSTKLPDFVFPIDELARKLSDAQNPILQEVRSVLDKFASVLSGGQTAQAPAPPFPLRELAAILKDEQAPLAREIRSTLDELATLLKQQEPPAAPDLSFPVDGLATAIKESGPPATTETTFPIDKLATLIGDTQTPIVGELRVALDKLAGLITTQKQPRVSESSFPLAELAALLREGQVPIVREVREAFSSLASLLTERQTPAMPEVVFPLDKLAALITPMNQTAPAQTISINVNVAEMVVREEADIHKVGQAMVDTIYLRQGIRT